MTKKIITQIVPMILLATIVCVGNLFAQAGTGGISGVVSDTTGAVVKGATVTLTNKATNQASTATTNDEGLYTFVSLQPGTYSVKTTSGSFAVVTLDVSVQVGRTTDANVTLGVSGVSAVVEVTAEGIQTTNNAFDSVQNETAIQNLPINGRRFQDFVTLTPTAQVDPSRGQISLSGQRGINTNVNVDGVDYNQPFFGGIRGGERSNSAFTLPQEAIREFQVVAAGYNAEFGRSSGGVVNVVTKSGTNDFRGSAFYLIRPDRFARPNDFAKALQEQRLNAIVVNGVTGVDATLAPTLQQFGGSIGGPIVKDRLFFFGTYEQQRFRAPRQVLFSTLVGLTPAVNQTEIFNYYRTLEVPYQQTNDAKGALAKIDWQVNNANRASIRLNYSKNEALNGVSTGESSFDPTVSRSISNNGNEGDKTYGGVGQLISNLSSTMINELRFQYAKEERPRLANEISPNVFTSIGEFGTRNFLPTTQFDTRYQVIDALTYIKGGHTFKFGGEYSRLFAAQVFGQGQTGEYSLSLGTGGVNIPNTLQFLGNTAGVNGTRPYLGRFDVTQAVYRKQIGNLQAEIPVKELSFFGQDSWRVTQKFTLNYGLRVENQYNPDPELSNTDLVNLVRGAAFPLYGGKGVDPTQIPDSGFQFGPRLGFAYDPFGDGKTVIRGFSGIYFARTPLLLLADSLNNYRNPAGNVRAILGNGGISVNQTTFNTFLGTAASAQYRAITGCVVGGTADQVSRCTPDTIFRQFAILGINLNSSAISALPTLTTAQIQTIAAAINPSFNPNVVSGIQVTSHDPNFKNPESYQFGGGIERELGQGLTAGLDFSWVKTIHLQRNVDVNLPAPITLDASIDPAQRQYIGISRPSYLPTTVALRARPISNLASVQVRESTANSLYRSATARIRLVRRWGQVNAFYTLSKNDSDDDNERDSGGVLYTNPYERSAEYYASRLDRTHQFVANPVFFLPWDFEVSSAIRLRSGNPVNVVAGIDANGDGLNNDRPFLVPGVELPRNYYRNRPVYDMDLRVQKSIHFGETRRLVLSSEFFNLFNLSNVQLGGNTLTYCTATTVTCGFSGTNNVNFLQVRDQNTTSVNFGKLNLVNNPGSSVFQVQVGARFYF